MVPWARGEGSAAGGGTFGTNAARQRRRIGGRGGDWGWACVLAFAYWDPRSGEPVTAEQAVRVATPREWTPRLGPATIACWGVFPSGLLRHPMLQVQPGH
jgi:hypothetical protein